MVNTGRPRMKPYWLIGMNVLPTILQASISISHCNVHLIHEEQEGVVLVHNSCSVYTFLNKTTTEEWIKVNYFLVSVIGFFTLSGLE